MVKWITCTLIGIGNDNLYVIILNQTQKHNEIVNTQHTTKYESSLKRKFMIVHFTIIGHAWPRILHQLCNSLRLHAHGPGLPTNKCLLRDLEFGNIEFYTTVGMLLTNIVISLCYKMEVRSKTLRRGEQLYNWHALRITLREAMKFSFFLYLVGQLSTFPFAAACGPGPSR